MVVVSSLEGYERGGRGRLKEDGHDCSLWWRMLSRIRRGVGLGEGSWFDNNVRRVVGGGGTTFFWTDNWVGGVPLRVRFPRLYDLAVDRWVSVKDMARRGWEDGGGAWVWRRRLFAREEAYVRECYVLLHDIVLQTHLLDRWSWLLDPVNGYSVKGTYIFLTTATEPTTRGLVEDVWIKNFPLKVSIFA